MEFFEADSPDIDELVDLYEAVGWSAYTAEPDLLATAVAGSTYVVTARASGKLIGLARGLSDHASIFYLQDVLVHPEHRRSGVGRRLLEMSLEKHSGVRQTVLMTDDEGHVHDLYRSLGFRSFPTADGLHGFVRIASPV